jgi:hypothetical protein
MVPDTEWAAAAHPTAPEVPGVPRVASKESAWHGRDALRMVAGAWSDGCLSARHRHAEPALSGHGPYGTSTAHIVRTESRRLIITRQRITAPTRALAFSKHSRRRAVRGTQKTGEPLPPTTSKDTR